MGARTRRDDRGFGDGQGPRSRRSCWQPQHFVGITQEAAGAIGTPPTPSDDFYQFERKEAFDVLLNDSDTESDPLTVTSNTQPAHGTATCLPTGACTYTANAGYVGPDEFDYTVTDAGANTATAIVSLDITGSITSENPPTPTPDEIVTKAGTPVTTNVLANDQSSSGTVAKDVGPTHGTATCTAAGSCTYTPTAGFVGYDGFRVHGHRPVRYRDGHRAHHRRRRERGLRRCRRRARRPSAEAAPSRRATPRRGPSERRPARRSCPNSGRTPTRRPSR